MFWFTRETKIVAIFLSARRDIRDSICVKSQFSNRRTIACISAPTLILEYIIHICEPRITYASMSSYLMQSNTGFLVNVFWWPPNTPNTILILMGSQLFLQIIRSIDTLESQDSSLRDVFYRLLFMFRVSQSRAYR